MNVNIIYLLVNANLFELHLTSLIAVVVFMKLILSSAVFVDQFLNHFVSLYHRNVGVVDELLIGIIEIEHQKEVIEIIPVRNFSLLSEFSSLDVLSLRQYFLIHRFFNIAFSIDLISQLK